MVKNVKNEPGNGQDNMERVVGKAIINRRSVLIVGQVSFRMTSIRNV